MDVDLIVCGAGPAGLASALHAARTGLEVAVFDPRPSPIDKACGEGLMPGAVRELDALGIRVAGQPLRGIRYTDGRTVAEARFRGGPGRGLRRTELQAALMDALAAAGVSVRPQRIESISQDAASVHAGGVTGRYLIAADGLHSPIRRRLGLDRTTRPNRGRPRWGLRQHFAIAPWTELVEVHWAADSEAYVTPVGPQLVGVALLGSTRVPFAEALRAFPALRERLPSDLSESVSKVRGAGPLRQRVRSRVSGRVLLVGDASGYVDALTGEGIAVSLACARAAVDCIRTESPERYEQRWRTLSRRYRLITETLLWARNRPVLASAITPAAARLPAVFAALVDQLAR
jgi:flavin-dependent dehydrogenase